jgi:hypothetical protein
MENLAIYNASRKPPVEALREIKAGRLKGKSDINPMWRIKSLTEQFGPCGFGWKYVITRQWLETGSAGQLAAFVNIELFYKLKGEWSDAVPGTGGSSFVENESKGPYTSDECYKMALTDAISVACKALGFGADVYWGGDRTKYDSPPKNGQQLKAEPPLSPIDKIISGIDFFSEKKKTVAELETWYTNDEGSVVPLKAELTPDELALANKYYAQIKATLKPATQQKTQLRPGVTDAQPGDFF